MTKPKDCSDFMNPDKMRSLIERAHAGNPHAIRRLRELGVHVSPSMFVGINVPGLPRSANHMIWAMTRDFGLSTMEEVAEIVSGAERVLSSDARYAEELRDRGRAALPDVAWTDALRAVAQRMRLGHRI